MVLNEMHASLQRLAEVTPVDGDDEEQAADAGVVIHVWHGSDVAYRVSTEVLT